MSKKIFSAIAIVFTILILLGAHYAMAAPRPVTGWAWFGADCTDPTEASCGITIDPIGWISFSSTNLGCSLVSYGVFADYNAAGPSPNDSVTGYAWIGVGDDADNENCDTSENSVGWLDFNYSTPHPCGTVGYPPDVPANYCYAAKLVESGGKWYVRGWAPIISKDASGAQTIVTWVRFESPTGRYKIKINKDEIGLPDGSIGTPGLGNNDHYAWSNFAGAGDSFGGGGLGWIDFNNPPLVQVLFPIPNKSPSASNLTVNQRYCERGMLDPVGSYNVNFSWIYTDPELNQERRFDFRVNDANDVTGLVDPLEIDRSVTGLDLPSPSQNEQLAVVHDSGELDFSTTYFWWVRVYDDYGDSGWVAGLAFGTHDHAGPDVDFIWTPPNPSVGETVTFDPDSTQTFGGTSIKSYLWQITEGSGTFTATTTPTDRYPKIKFSTQENKVALTITDTDDFACTEEKSVGLQPPLPQYKEISPAAFLSRLFISLAKAIKSLFALVI